MACCVPLSALIVLWLKIWALAEKQAPQGMVQARECIICSMYPQAITATIRTPLMSQYLSYD